MQCAFGREEGLNSLHPLPNFTSVNQTGGEDVAALWRSWAQGRVISQSKLSEAPRCSPLLPSQPGETWIPWEPDKIVSDPLWNATWCPQAMLHSIFCAHLDKRSRKDVFLCIQRQSMTRPVIFCPTYPRKTLTGFSCTKSPTRKGRKGKSEDKSTSPSESRQREESTLLYSDGSWSCTS